MSDKEYTVAQGNITSIEKKAQEQLLDSLFTSSIPRSELLHNLSIFMPRQNLARVLFCYELIKATDHVFGDIMTMGVRWGFDMAQFLNLKATLSPYAFDKNVIGFDTFSGFASTSAADGGGALIKDGSYSVSENYEDELERILTAHKFNAPRSNVSRFSLVKGDIVETLPAYLEQRPQTVVSLLYIDLDLYSPTKTSLDLLVSRIPKGGIIAFDELNHDKFPGETVALLDSFDLAKVELKKFPWLPGRGYIVV